MKQLAALLLLGTTAFAQQHTDVAQNTPIEANVSIPAKAIHHAKVQNNPTGKRHENVVKPIAHQNNHALFMSNIGMQYAFLATPEHDNAYLSAIALPLMKAAFEAEGRPGIFEKVAFHTLMKIELLENNNGRPGNKIEGFEQTAIVTNAENNKRFDIILANEAALPKEGIFIQLTIAGRCDAAGNLNHDRDFVLSKDKDGNEDKWMEYCQPNFPLTPSPKGTTTFYKNPNLGTGWHTINEPALHEIKKYPDFNIGFGYTTAAYK